MNINKITEILSNNYDVDVTSVTKGGIKKVAIVVKNGDVQPMFYPYDYDHCTEEEIAMMIISTMKNLEIPSVNMGIFETYAGAEPTLRVGIRPKVDDDTVHHNYLDLDLYLYMQIDNEKSAKIKTTMVERWGVSETVLWADAISNTKAGLVVKSMIEVIADMMGVDVDDLPSECNQVIIKNDNNFRASSALMMPDILNTAASKLDATQIIILPSSIHELIVMADNGDFSYDDLNSMVVEVNYSQVAPEDRLADHIYLHNTITGETTCA